MIKGAILSTGRKYRYVLWRNWDTGSGNVMFVGLNPSTADETEDDPTIRRCIGYARDWGFGGIYMLNLFAYRATKPKILNGVEYPIGPMNDKFLEKYHKLARLSIACWGNHGAYHNRGRDVIEKLGAENLSCLGVTQEGQPRHPLYLKRGLKPSGMYYVEWRLQVEAAGLAVKAGGK